MYLAHGLSAMKMTHEEKVERFYSHGSERRSCQEGGFLSFGYWDEDTRDYEQAVRNLLDRILKREKPLHGGSVLDVACGYGAETFVIYERLKPGSIVAIDITESHIEFARGRALARGLSDHVNFEKMDACSIPFGDACFDYVVGIEGPAHFNTREMFLRRAYDVLCDKGVLLLSDIIVDREVTEGSWFNRNIGRFCSRHWFMPTANWMSAAELASLLKGIGFRDVTIDRIGEHVYPGFARFNMRWSSIVNAVRVRGFRIGLALTFISWLLGFTYRLGLTDYVIIRGVK